VAPRLAVPGGERAPPAAPRRCRPDVPRRPARAGLARHPHPGGAGHAGRRAARRPGRGARRGVGTAAPTGRSPRCPACSGRTTTGPASSRGTRSSSDAWRRHPNTRLGRSGLVMESLVPGDRRAEGDRAGGVRRVPAAGAPVRRARARPGPRARSSGSSPPRRHSAGPVMGVAADAHRPGPVARHRHRRPVADSLERTIPARPRGGRRRLRTIAGVGGGPAPRCASAPTATPTP
jgi:hypothetical protein